MIETDTDINNDSFDSLISKPVKNMQLIHIIH